MDTFNKENGREPGFNPIAVADVGNDLSVCRNTSLHAASPDHTEATAAQYKHEVVQVWFGVLSYCFNSVHSCIASS
jgi:hypothetical protein